MNPELILRQLEGAFNAARDEQREERRAAQPPKQRIALTRFGGLVPDFERMVSDTTTPPVAPEAFWRADCFAELAGALQKLLVRWEHGGAYFHTFLDESEFELRLNVAIHANFHSRPPNMQFGRLISGFANSLERIEEILTEVLGEYRRRMRKTSDTQFQPFSEVDLAEVSGMQGIFSRFLGTHRGKPGPLNTRYAFLCVNQLNFELARVLKAHMHNTPETLGRRVVIDARTATVQTRFALADRRLLGK